MLEYFGIIVMTFVLVVSQRPPYAGSGNRYPAVLPQYLSPTPVIQQQAPVVITPISNRNNNNEENMSNEFQLTSIDQLPVEAKGDVDLINRIKTWPREKWPFWYLNWQQLEEHRGKLQPTNPSFPTTYYPYQFNNNINNY